MCLNVFLFGTFASLKEFVGHRDIYFSKKIKYFCLCVGFSLVEK